MKNIYYAATDTAEPALVVETENKAYRLNSAFSPEHEVSRWSEQFEADGVKKVVCLFGMGTGLFAEELLKKVSSDSRLIIYEPSREVIDFINSQKADGDVELNIANRLNKILNNPQVSLCIESESPLKFAETLKNELDFYLVEGMIVTGHNMYDRVYPESFARFLHEINTNRERIMVNKNTMARFHDTASDNVLTNMWILEKMNLVSELNIIPKDVPVIIVSAGPSLDKNIETLKKAKGHSLIFAVDTALKYLMNHDIMPDLTITVEPIKPPEHYQDPRTEEIPAVFDIESNPQIVGKHRSRIFLYNCRDYVKNVLCSLGKEVPDPIPSGGSVATAAFAIVSYLEMKNIIMIGQDLAYSGESTHAGGVTSKGINNDIGYVMVDGYYGDKVRTRTDWIGYLRWFENNIAALDKEGKNINVIDATEGGALIHGTSIMPLEEAIEKFCRDADGNYIDYDFKKHLESYPCFLTSEEYAKVPLKVAYDLDKLKEMKQKAEKAGKYCRELIEKADKEKIRYISEVRAFCEASPMYPIINNYAVSEIADEVSKLRLASGSEEKIRINTLKQEQLAFEAIARACDRFMSREQV